VDIGAETDTRIHGYNTKRRSNLRIQNLEAAMVIIITIKFTRNLDTNLIKQNIESSQFPRLCLDTFVIGLWLRLGFGLYGNFRFLVACFGLGESSGGFRS
jgi:hypothetical protein